MTTATWHNQYVLKTEKGEALIHKMEWYGPKATRITAADSIDAWTRFVAQIKWNEGHGKNTGRKVGFETLLEAKDWAESHLNK